MSASKKKAQYRAQRDDKRRQEEQRDRRSVMIYSVIAAVVIIAAIVMMVVNSGILQRSLTAVTVNGVKYTAPEVQYYYSSIYTNQAANYAFDTSTSVKKQVYDQETGQTWHDHLIEQAIEELTLDTALAARAESEGYTLSQQAQDSVNATLAQLDTAWISYGASSREALIRANFGTYMTYDTLVSLIRREALASDYASAQLEAISHSDSECEDYYQENAGSLDTIVFTQFAFRAMVEPTYDEEGNAIERSEDEQAAAMDEQKKLQKELAEEVKAKLEAGEDPEALSEEYADQVSSSFLSRAVSGAYAGNSVYADWLMDDSRQAGDVTITEYETVDSYYYYVNVFENRYRDDEPTHSVRHVLIRAQGDVATSTPTETQYNVAEEEAQALLDEWKAGEATEDSFAQLATAHSEDTGSASSGGLISGINATSTYVDAFQNWALDPARRPGDTELVKSEYGWHIMYYSSTDDPAWKLTAQSALRSEDYEQLKADVIEGWTASQGAGVRFVGV